MTTYLSVLPQTLYHVKLTLLTSLSFQFPCDHHVSCISIVAILLIKLLLILLDVQTDQESAKMKVIIQEVPEKLVIVSRPRKERFLMLPVGGRIESSVQPKVQINFPAHTLNTSTKVILQVNFDKSLTL